MVSVYGILSDIHSFCGINKIVFIILTRLRIRTAADLNCFLDLESRLDPRRSAAGLESQGLSIFVGGCFVLLTFYPKNRGDSYPILKIFSQKKKSSPLGLLGERNSGQDLREFPALL